MTENTRNIAGFQVDETVAGYASTGTHLVAGFIPNPIIGSGIDLIASTMDRETAQLALINSFKTAIAKRLHVTEEQVDIDLVSSHLDKLPPALQAEWEKMDDLSGKTLNFLASGWAQIAGGALLGSMLGIAGGPPGMIVGLIGGFGAGYVASKLMKDVTGELDELTTTEAIAAIHQTAAQAAGHGKTAASIDETLLGAYLIAAHSGKGQPLEGYNSEELKEMFTEHMQARANGDTSRTRLDEYIHGLNAAADNPFAMLLPKTVDVSKIQSGGVLGTIAKNMHSQDDLENWMFNPHLAQQQLEPQPATNSLSMQQVKQAGGQLYNAMGAEIAAHAPPAKAGKDSALGLS